MKDWLWEIGALELAGVVGGSFLSRTRVNKVNNPQKLGYIYIAPIIKYMSVP